MSLLHARFALVALCRAPRGLLATARLFDLLALALNHHAGLFTATYYMTAAGIIGGLLAAAGAALATITGWLGGELVDRLGVGSQACPFGGLDGN